MAVVPWLTAGTTAATVLFMVARFFATYAMNVGFQICVEVKLKAGRPSQPLCSCTAR